MNREYRKYKDMTPEQRRAIESTLKGPPKRKTYSREEKESIRRTLKCQLQ